jgi:hypothetical protein
MLMPIEGKKPRTLQRRRQRPSRSASRRRPRFPRVVMMSARSHPGQQRPVVPACRGT